MESRREGGLTGQKRAIESSKKRPREMGEREGERMDGILGGGGGEAGAEKGRRGSGAREASGLRDQESLLLDCEDAALM